MLNLMSIDDYIDRATEKFWKAQRLFRDPLIEAFMRLHAANYAYDYGLDRLLDKNYSYAWDIAEQLQLITDSDRSDRVFKDWDELLFLMQAILERPFEDGRL